MALLRDSLDVTKRARQLVDSSGRVRFTNAAYSRIFPTIDVPLISTLSSLIAAGSDAARKLQQLTLSLEQTGQGRADIDVIMQFGDREILDVSACQLHGFSGFVLWSLDIVTERRQIEEYIRSDHEKFADLVEHAPIGFYSVDENGAFQFVNETLENWLDLPSDENGVFTVKLHDLVVGALPPGTPSYSPFADPAARSGEVMLRRPNGQVMQAYIRHAVAAVQAGGKRTAIRTRSVVHDLSREQELERALQVSEQYFQRFFEEAPTGIALIDTAGRIEQANRAFQQLADAGNWRDAPMIELVHPDDRGAVTEHFSAVLDNSRPLTPLTVRLAGQAQHSVTIFASRRDDKEGKSLGIIAHFIDATEQKRLEVQFAQSQKMQAVGLLAGGIAHDFNNLLTAMIGFCDLLLLRHRAGDQSFADIMQIKQNANRAANLVRQLLAFSRQQTLQPRVLSITDVLAELSHLLRRLIGENIELNMVHGRDLRPVRVDQGQLEQVIINLAVNARDAMPNGGNLTIRTENITTAEPLQRGAEVMPVGNYVLIEMKDSGTGIPAEIIDRIFEPFFSTKAVGSGTGLGLSTVYGIVRQTGGFVFVDSWPGAGAAFRIYLPQHMAAAGGDAKIDASEEAPRDLTGIGTILLVEDEDAVRLFSARALRNKGYQVLEARSGEAALEILNEHLEEVNLIISDVVMPRMDGPELIKEVRARRSNMPVIFISGYAEDAFRRRVDAGEEAHFLLKPFTLKQLAAKVKEVLDQG
ncbi:response regulator [Dongia soli]|uniref:histidine kinase n=1 Tax=Dongia soli TaxID=600628 RepID=A0ABU5E8Z3_9PROT|nr:response regulator [Dongia soli]MDY0882683.1 response regulator [Dongia soli]